MLRIEITDDDCGPETCYAFKVSLDTDWSDIQTAVRLLYPTASTVSIIVEET